MTKRAPTAGEAAKMTDRDCRHGRMARKCEVCELEQHVRELEVENERLRHDLDRLQEANAKLLNPEETDD